MTRTVEQRLQRMEDIEDIKQLIARYATAADHNGDPAMMAPLFSADSSWNCEGIGGWQGRDAVVAGLREVSTTGITWALHYMTQPIIKVAEDGASAEGEYYLWELARVIPEGGPPQDTWIGGWYETTFVKQDGAWLFNHMELVLKLKSPTDRPTWDTVIPPWTP